MKFVEKSHYICSLDWCDNRVFVHIMGHFVHSFESNVVAHNAEALEETAMEYVKSTLTLKQLRQGTFTFNYMLKKKFTLRAPFPLQTPSGS